MEPRCATCGGTPSEGKQIQTLSELGFGPEDDGARLHLCSDCLETRNAKRWEPGRQMTGRVLSVLEGTAIQRPQGRYSYLKDPDEGVHLLRLQDEWTRSHAEHGSESADFPG